MTPVSVALYLYSLQPQPDLQPDLQQTPCVERVAFSIRRLTDHCSGIPTLAAVTDATSQDWWLNSYMLVVPDVQMFLWKTAPHILSSAQTHFNYFVNPNQRACWRFCRLRLSHHCRGKSANSTREVPHEKFCALTELERKTHRAMASAQTGNPQWPHDSGT